MPQQATNDLDEVKRLVPVVYPSASVQYISKMSCRLALLGLLELVTPVIPARQFSATSDARHSSQMTSC